MIKNNRKVKMSYNDSNIKLNVNNDDFTVGSNITELKHKNNRNKPDNNFKMEPLDASDIAQLVMPIGFCLIAIFIMVFFGIIYPKMVQDKSNEVMQELNSMQENSENAQSSTHDNTDYRYDEINHVSISDDGKYGE